MVIPLHQNYLCVTLSLPLDASLLEHRDRLIQFPNYLKEQVKAGGVVGRQNQERVWEDWGRRGGWPGSVAPAPSAEQCWLSPGLVR